MTITATTATDRTGKTNRLWLYVDLPDGSEYQTEATLLGVSRAIALVARKFGDHAAVRAAAAIKQAVHDPPPYALAPEPALLVWLADGELAKAMAEVRLSLAKLDTALRECRENLDAGLAALADGERILSRPRE